MRTKKEHIAEPGGNWRDERRSPGDDRPPREEQEPLEKLKAQMMRAGSAPEMTCKNYGGGDADPCGEPELSADAPDFSWLSTGRKFACGERGNEWSWVQSIPGWSPDSTDGAAL
jgi:hypothetical protein